MPVPSRPLPRLGAPARILHFGGGAAAAVITRVAEEGRLVEVRAEDGSLHEFRLNRATARFTSSRSAQGERLELLRE